MTYRNGILLKKKPETKPREPLREYEVFPLIWGYGTALPFFPSLGLRPRPLGDAIGCWHDDWVKGFWVKLNICRGFLTFIW